MTPLERAGRAAHILLLNHGFDLTQIEAEQVARAVLQAIREPSGGMCRAAWVKRMKYTGCGIGESTGEIWRTMIDAALEERD